MNIFDEIKNCTVADLELILSTQEDLYTDVELEQIRAQLITKKQEEDAAHQKKVLDRLPKEILCPKCDGPNAFENEVCSFCGVKLDKSIYYSDDYYEDEQDYYDPSEPSEPSNSYTFHYIISFLIPLVGFIVGAIMLSKDDVERSTCGKKCIILGLISAIISGCVLLL